MNQSKVNFNGKEGTRLLLDAYQRGEHELAIMRIISLAPALDAETIVSLAEQMASISFSAALAALLSALAEQFGEGNLALLKRVLELLKRADAKIGSNP